MIAITATPRSRNPENAEQMRPPKASILAVLAVGALAAAGCGSSSRSSSATSTQVAPPAGSATAATPQAAPPATSSTAATPPALDDLAAAENPDSTQFPPSKGRTLTQLGALARASAQLGAATGTFTPGTRRLAFGLTTTSGAFIYAPTAIYIARTPAAPAQGPFIAPADPMEVAPAYRSKQNSGPGGIKAIYHAQISLKQTGTYTVLSLTRTPSGLVGAPGEVAVAASSPIPDVGQRPPDVATDTAATVHGDAALLTTRLPPERMQSVSFDRVLGKRPVALLFSTPQLCISRVCGPVTDIAVALQQHFGQRVTFIHEEVYVDNQPSKGLRPQLKAFHLETEPWLFTVNRRGVIAARLEGAFGVTEFTQALEAALR